MRSIRGWIINLQDGLGPAPGSVAVSAKPESTNTELDLSTHGLGRLDRVHLLGGSGSALLADNIGHFGWDMELGPGPIDVRVTPSDPQVEFRRRFPDESSPVGKAFISDLERVGWSGGHSGMAWNAVSNGHGGNREDDNYIGWSFGNGSIASFGSGADAGRFVIRRFLALLGGVPFSVEMGDLLVPIVGQPAAPNNSAGTDRWDLYCAVINDDASSSSYGKQSFERTQGNPGAGIPNFPGSAGGSLVRRLPLHALKMPAGSSVYTDACDLRRWLPSPPELTFPSPGLNAAKATTQTFDGPSGSAFNVPAEVNSYLADFFLPLANAYQGSVIFESTVHLQENLTSQVGSAWVSCITNGVDPAGTVVTPNMTDDTFSGGLPWIHVGTDDPNVPFHHLQTSHTWRIPYIGDYQFGHRKWTRLRVRFQISAINYTIFHVTSQRATAMFNILSGE